MRKVEICGVNTAKLPLLNNEEMRALFVQAQAGDKPARDQLVQSNLRLVLSIVQRFGNRGENPDDLFQVGCIGLLKAIDNFDLSMNVRFSTYAVPMIIGEIRRYLRDNNAIRVSRSVRDVAYKALSARDELAAQKGVEPKMQEIAERLSLPASWSSGIFNKLRATSLEARMVFISYGSSCVQKSNIALYPKSAPSSDTTSAA